MKIVENLLTIGKIKTEIIGFFHERSRNNRFQSMESEGERFDNKRSEKHDNKDKESEKDDFSEFKEKQSFENTHQGGGRRRSKLSRHQRKRRARRNNYNEEDNISGNFSPKDNNEQIDGSIPHHEVDKAKNVDLLNLKEKVNLPVNNKNELKSGECKEKSSTSLDINIKKENIESLKEDNIPVPASNLKKEQQESSSSSGSSTSDSDSESEDSDLVALKMRVKSNLLGETNPKNTTMNKLTTKNIPSSTSSSSSSSSSDSDSDEDKTKQTKTSQDDVICLGDVKNVETLIDEDEKICLLCDEKGHTSFYCQMICKNCGGKYHGLKDCLKPANVSIVLQSFMEFCLQQCYRYNPEQNFALKDITLKPNNIQSTYESEQDTNATKSIRKRKRDCDVKTDHKADTSYSSSEEATPKKRALPRQMSMSTTRTNSESAFPSGTVPFPNPFPALSLPYNPQAIFNSLMPFSQLMGYNPSIHFPSNLKKND